MKKQKDFFKTAEKVMSPKDIREAETKAKKVMKTLKTIFVKSYGKKYHIVDHETKNGYPICLCGYVSDKEGNHSPFIGEIPVKDICNKCLRNFDSGLKKNAK